MLQKLCKSTQLSNSRTCLNLGSTYYKIQHFWSAHEHGSPSVEVHYPSKWASWSSPRFQNCSSVGLDYLSWSFWPNVCAICVNAPGKEIFLVTITLSCTFFELLQWHSEPNFNSNLIQCTLPIILLVQQSPSGWITYGFECHPCACEHWVHPKDL